MEVERPDAASSRAAEIDALARGGGVPALAEAHGYVAEDDGQNYERELAEANICQQFLFGDISAKFDLHSSVSAPIFGNKYWYSFCSMV